MHRQRRGIDEAAEIDAFVVRPSTRSGRRTRARRARRAGRRRRKRDVRVRRGMLVFLRAGERVREFGAADVAEQGFGARGVDDGVALEAGLVEEAVDVAEAHAGGGEADDVRGHDFADGDAEGVVLFGVEEGVAVEVDHAVCDAAVAEAL